MTATKSKSPRTHCLRCGRAISAQQLAAHGIHDPLFGFCGPAHEMNFAVALDQWKRSATKVSSLQEEERALLADIARKTLSAPVAQIRSDQRDSLLSLAKRSLVVLQGKNGAKLTVRGEISYIYGRVDEKNQAVASEQPDQDPEHFSQERDYHDEELYNEEDAEAAFERRMTLQEHGYNWKW